MPHLLHEMKSSRVPRRFVFFDTEAHRRSKGGIETQTWRLGVTCEINWEPKAHRWSAPIWTHHASIDSLWQTITAAARPHQRTVVVAHNLSYDIRIADGFTRLADLGWHFEKLVLAANHTGFDVVRDGERLVFVDSTTVLPVSLEHLGKQLGIKKTDLPVEDDSDEAWWERCRVDVQILASGYLSVIDALRTQDLGGWARTGSGMGWNTFIRRHLADKVLVHENEPLREIEHEAIYGGRFEAWRWGRLGRAVWHEWDYELAYANVLATEVLPAYYEAKVTGLTMSHVRRTYPGTRWLINAEVAVDSPTLPIKDDHGTFFPIGTFTGWWWDCELLNAAEEGAHITILSAHKYRGEPWLQTWGSWIIDTCADTSSPQAKVLAIAAKHWQRSVVGRSAMRYANWSEYGEAYIRGVSFMEGHDLDSGTSGAIFQAGGRRWESWERTWWDQALPQLLSAVSAHCRVNLWGAMKVAGLEHIAYVDTDSLIVDGEGADRLRHSTSEGALGSLREKSTLSRLNVWAPRYVTSPNFTKIAGVAEDRTEIGEHKYSSSSWERLVEALSHGHPSEVIIRQVKATLSLEDWHRRHLPGGRTEAYCVLDGVRVELEAASKTA